MKTIISNKIYIYDATQELQNWAALNLIVNNPTYDTLMRIGKVDQARRMHISPKMALFVQKGHDIVLPFGTLYAIWGMIKDYPYELDLNQSEPISCATDKITQPLYDYQEEAVKNLVAAKMGALIASCGAGKTNMAIEIIKRIGKNALWLCHTKDLLNQTAARIKSLYPNMRIGTITDGKVDMVKDGITIATVQTLANIDPEIYKNEFETVMTDEFHHLSGSPTLSKYFFKVISNIPARYKFGVSATEKRNDSLTLSMYASIGANPSGEFKPVYIVTKDKTATLTATHQKVELDTPFCYEMLNADGTFNFANLVDYLANNEQRNDKICSDVYQNELTGRKQLVLCSRVEQCEQLHKKLTELGSKAVLLVGKVSDKKRKEILNRQVEWNTIIATMSLAKEGLDIKELDTLYLTSVVCNKSDTIQATGRIERPCDGKKEPIVYDYVDIKIPYCVNRFNKRKNFLKNR